MELHKLSDDQREAFIREVATTAKAIAATFNPVKINYGAYANTLSHLHIHVVPKYRFWRRF